MVATLYFIHSSYGIAEMQFTKFYGFTIEFWRLLESHCNTWCYFQVCSQKWHHIVNVTSVSHFPRCCTVQQWDTKKQRSGGVSGGGSPGPSYLVPIIPPLHFEYRLFKEFCEAFCCGSQEYGNIRCIFSFAAWLCIQNTVKKYQILTIILKERLMTWTSEQALYSILSNNIFPRKSKFCKETYTKLMNTNRKCLHCINP